MVTLCSCLTLLKLQPQPHYQKLVCGPRGVGKSTAVHRAMEGKSGVGYICSINFASCSTEAFFFAVLESLRFKHHAGLLFAAYLRDLGQISIQSL